jgi:hypothetical protein
MDLASPQDRLLSPAVAIGQIIERIDTCSLKERAQMHVIAHAETPIILSFNCSHVGIVSFISKLAVLASGAVSAHPFSILCHCFNLTFNPISC